ncbi:hypothetical protein M0805_006021 [Coniferiporia weirii]|nr:hypothetical protein M0805_006021 [Coniferiporia weirii]
MNEVGGYCSEGSSCGDGEVDVGTDASSVPEERSSPSSLEGYMRHKPSQRSAVDDGKAWDATASSTERTYEEENKCVDGEHEKAIALVKIPVKLHYKDDTRRMTLAPDTTLIELMERAAVEFGHAPSALALKFVDGDAVGGRTELREEGDRALAIKTAHERAEGELEVWVSDALKTLAWALA